MLGLHHYIFDIYLIHCGIIPRSYTNDTFQSISKLGYGHLEYVRYRNETTCHKITFGWSIFM